MKKGEGFGMFQMIMILMVTVALIGYAPKTVRSESKPIRWRCHAHFPESSFMVKGTINLARKITERSKGRLVIETFPAAGLGYKGQEMLRVISDGLIEMSEVLSIYVVTDVPSAAGSDLLMTYRDFGEVKYVAKNIIRPKWEPLFLKKFNTKIMSLSGTQLLHLFTKKPVSKLGDFKGLKIRTTTPVEARLWKQLGAIGVTLPTSELYTALKTGLVNAVTTSFMTCRDYRFWEVLNYANILNYGVYPGWMIAVNKDSFQKLPSDLQAIVIQACKEHEEEMWAADELTGYRDRDKVMQQGMKINFISDNVRDQIAEVAKKNNEEWVEECGPDANEMFQAITKALNDYRAGKK